MGAAVTADKVNAVRLAFVADLARRLKLQPRPTAPAPVDLFASLRVEKPTTETAEPKEQPQQAKTKRGR
jgi:hypothetical protein